MVKTTVRWNLVKNVIILKFLFKFILHCSLQKNATHLPSPKENHDKEGIFRILK